MFELYKIFKSIKNKKSIYALLLACLLLPFVSPALAESEEGTYLSHHVEVESVSFDRPFWVAVEFDIPEGQSIKLNSSLLNSDNWQLPKGFKVSEVAYPSPEGFTENTMTASYTKPVTILYEILPPPAYEVYDFIETIPFSFIHELGFEVCNSNCTSKTVSYSFELFHGNGLINDKTQDVFMQARLNSLPPLPFPVEAYLGVENYVVKIKAEQKDLSAHVVFIPTMADFNYTIAKVKSFDDGVFTLQGEILSNSQGPYFKNITGVLSEFDGQSLSGAYKFTAPNMKEEVITWGEPKPKANEGYSFIIVLGLAFVGGLILNLMPCVFPVLAMKAFNLSTYSQKSSREMRIDGLAYSLGIIVSFVIIASILIIIRNMGVMVGWGFQLQSPYFVLLLTLLMLTVSLSFLGVFKLNLAFLQNLGSSNLIVNVFGGGERAKSFSTGVLATVVATPCTAPFMAPALGFALMQPALSSLSIFVTLGAGLAFPYLLISFIPAIGRRMPQSGPWLNTFQKWLSLPLALTAIWLLWVLSQQISPEALLMAIGSLLLLLFAFYSKAKKLAITSLLLGAVLFFYVGNNRISQEEGVALPGLVNGLETVVWSPQTVSAYRQEGRAIFLNVTASWCITCLVHERLVFENDSFQRYMKENNIVYMVADWTNPDARIAKLLEQNGRSGIPFYVFYPADNNKSQVLLPEVLTPASTIKILEQNQ